jgi:hypothetical protein
MMKKQQGVSLVVFFFFFCFASAKVCTFNYSYTSNSLSFNWNTPSTWMNGEVPVTGDDISLVGAGQFVGVWQTLVMPSTPISVNSIFLNAADIALSFPVGIVVTTSNFTILDPGCNITAKATTTFIITEVLFFNASGAAALVHVTFNITSQAYATWQTPQSQLTTVDVVVNNNGLFEPDIYDEEYGIGDGVNPFTFNNYGTVSLIGNPEGYDFVFAFVGRLNNWGKMVATPGVTMQAGATYGNPINLFDNYGTIQIDGFFLMTETVNVTFHPGSTFTGQGQVTLWSECDNNGWLFVDQDFYFEGLFIVVGCIEIESSGTTLNFTHLDWNGGAFIGSGAITVYNLTHNNPTEYQALGDNLLYGRNMTITNFWEVSFSQGIMYLGDNAYIICARGSNLYYQSTTYIEQWTNDIPGSVVGFVDYSYTIADQYDFSAIQYLVTYYGYGNIFYPPYWVGVPGLTGTGTPCGFQPQAGGVLAGNITATLSIIGTYGCDSINWGVGIAEGPFTIASTAHFSGGVFYFGGYLCEDDNWAVIACWLPNMYTWEGRPANTTVGDGIITSDQGCIFNIVGPNVVFENFWALDGQIVGSHNLTVITGLFEDDPDAGTQWSINGTSLNIQSTFNFTSGLLNSYNNGKLVGLKGSTLYITDAGVADYGDGDQYGGIYSYGTISLIPSEQDITYYFYANIFLFGPLYINSIEQYTDEPYGDTLQFNNIFENNGIVYLKVYTAQYYDSIAILNDTCEFSGTYSLHFQGYTPKANDQFLIMTNGENACTGLFTVTSDNLASDMSLRVLYDQFVSGVVQINHYAVVCSNTNTSCLAITRNPEYLTTGSAQTGTASTSGSNNS